MVLLQAGEREVLQDREREVLQDREREVLQGREAESNRCSGIREFRADTEVNTITNL